MQQELYLKYKEYFEINKDIFSFAQKLMELHKQQSIPLKEDDYFRKVVLLFFIRAYYLFRSANVLLREGLGEDALVLVRTLLENCAYLLYIEKEPKSRSEEYLRSEIVGRKLLKDNLDKYKDSSGSIIEEIEKHPEKINSLNCEYDEFKKEYKHNFDKKGNYKLFGKSIGQIIKSISEGEKIYSIIYLKFSTLVHPNALSISDFIKNNSEGGWLIEVGYNDYYTDTALITNASLFFTILKIFNSAFELGEDRTIEETEKKLNEFNKNKIINICLI